MELRVGGEVELHFNHDKISSEPTRSASRTVVEALVPRACGG
jgi:hypothetical protein